jgi:putative NIF3 family GTP cyclohydrolase 1 type 2
MYKGKLNIVQEAMNRMDIDILGISEMKWTGRGHCRSVNNKVIYLGHNTTEKMVWE